MTSARITCNKKQNLLMDKVTKPDADTITRLVYLENKGKF